MKKMNCKLYISLVPGTFISQHVQLFKFGHGIRPRNYIPSRQALQQNQAAYSDAVHQALYVSGYAPFP
jgi:hypothetical protein